MAPRSLAGKLGGLLPRRAPPSHPTALELEKELAEFQKPVTRDTAKRMIEDIVTAREEVEERIRRYKRARVLFIATNVGIWAFCISGIIKNFEEMRKGRIEAVRKAVNKAMPSQP